jgi:hypothetical protein
MLGFGWLGAVRLQRGDGQWTEPEWIGEARKV